MSDLLALAGANLLSPMVLFFVLGVAAALARSDLAMPEQVAKALSLYLLLAIGYKGGVSVAEHGLDARLVAAVLVGIVLSAGLPLIAFGILRTVTRLPRVDAAAVSAHYGSISIVTFVAATAALDAAGTAHEGYLVAVAAAMEAPAILTALLLVGRRTPSPGDQPGALWREVALNGSIVLLVGAFIIGWITGPAGLAQVSAFIVDPFKGALCLFLLDMGLLAGRGLRQSRQELTMALVAFGMVMPLIGATLAGALGAIAGLSAGGLALLITLAASASYIAVPAAMRVALPEARPAIYLTLSLGITFPFNLTLGIPLYAALAQALAGT